jgi:hypothetical protein
VGQQAVAIATQYQAIPPLSKGLNNMSAVEFLKDRKGDERKIVMRIYSSADLTAAIAFLDAQELTLEIPRIGVRTPDGLICKGKEGIYASFEDFRDDYLE